MRERWVWTARWMLYWHHSLQEQEKEGEDNIEGNTFPFKVFSLPHRHAFYVMWSPRDDIQPRMRGCNNESEHEFSWSTKLFQQYSLLHIVGKTIFTVAYCWNNNIHCCILFEQQYSLLHIVWTTIFTVAYCWNNNYCLNNFIKCTAVKNMRNNIYGF